MQTLIILWEPSDKWVALSEDERKQYLHSLDEAVNEARRHGVMTLGWSKIDRSLPKAPAEGYVGIFAMTNAEQIHELDKNIQASGWYDYFDSVNVSINPEGGTNANPSEEYARILEMSL
ncbi:MAG: hypothetical protein GKR93_01125 [Gammaproteobacteria bacterium]|nr:hypothetical protein [Gammaproteobacteria bacterium]